MRILFDGENAFFATRSAYKPNRLIFRLPEKSALICNGRRFYSENGSVSMPKGILHMGNNDLALRIENRVFPCEGLFYDGTYLFPCGLPSEQLLIHQHERLCQMDTEISALKSRIKVLETASNARKLFV